MMRQKAGLLFLAAVFCFALPCLGAAAPPVKLRINTSHGLENARGAVFDAGLGPEQVLVTPSSAEDGKPYLPPDKFFQDGLVAGAKIISSSFNGWHYLYDSKEYLKLTASGMLHVYAYVPRTPQPAFAPPPAAFTTVTNISGSSGGGIEFGLPNNYMHGRGGSVFASGATAQLAGLMASLKYLHPSWNWFDVKAALRSTAANYPGGYDPQKYGYGAISYQDANALGSAADLALFAPAAIIVKQTPELIFFQVNPFQQSRRFADVLFRFTARPPETRKELTLAEITALGGEHLYSSYLHRNSINYKYRMEKGAPVYLVWFTQDAAMKFSRIEPYSIFGPFSYSSPPAPFSP